MMNGGDGEKGGKKSKNPHQKEINVHSTVDYNIIMHSTQYSISSIPRYIDTVVTKPNTRFKPVPVYTAPVTGTVLQVTGTV